MDLRPIFQFNYDSFMAQLHQKSKGENENTTMKFLIMNPCSVLLYNIREVNNKIIVETRHCGSTDCSLQTHTYKTVQ